MKTELYPLIFLLQVAMFLFVAGDRAVIFRHILFYENLYELIPRLMLLHSFFHRNQNLHIQ